MFPATFAVVSLGFWLYVASPRAPAAPPPTPASAWPATADTCGVALHLLAARPAPRHGEPELVWLQNTEPTSLSLAGFQLVAGRQKRPLPERIVDPGEVFALPAPRLRDREGSVQLVDPCGLSTHLAWSHAARDTPVLSPLALALDWRVGDGTAIVAPHIARDTLHAH